MSDDQHRRLAVVALEAMEIGARCADLEQNTCIPNWLRAVLRFVYDTGLIYMQFFLYYSHLNNYWCAFVSLF